MSKRNITYVKQRDPKFLQELKQQIGYNEKPSVETKRQKLDGLEINLENEETVEREDEKPQIVVINSGDLTAEEVAIEEKRLAKEAAEAPANLSKPIVFRKRHKAAVDLQLKTALLSTKKPHDKPKKLSKKSSTNSASKLSFNTEEEVEEEDKF